MRIAISSPIRWATGLAAVATIAMLAMRPPAPARDHGSRPVKRMSADLGRIHVEPSARADRIELAAIERDLDAMIDQLQVAGDAVEAATTDRERAVAREDLARLEHEIHDRAQRDQDRSDVLRSRLGE